MRILIPSRQLLGVAVVAVLAVCSSAGRAPAVVLFSDSFDRLDSRNIDNDLSGVTDNTGSALVVDGVYSQPFVDPGNEPGPQDGDAGNGGGAQILGSTLELAVGAGTSNAYINHNFVNSEILTAGAFSVSVDVLPGYGGATAEQGGAFAIGMSQAEADTAGDAWGSGSGGSAFQAAFNGGNTVVSDFWVGLRGNGTIAWGDGVTIQTAPVASNSGTISANFGVSDFNAGSIVSYEVFYDGVNVGVGSFRWSEDSTNFIGLDARTGTALGFDNLVVETSVPPVVPSLTINRNTGEITLTNETAQPLSMVVYSITSDSGGFDSTSWSTVESQGIDADDEWITLTDTSSAIVTDLSEGSLGEYTIAAAGTVNLGAAWVPSPFEDVKLELRDANGNDVPVIVQYTGDEIPLGDYDGSGVIDAGDWPTIRDNLVSDVSGMSAFEAYLSGDLTGDGRVDRDDFRQFKALWEEANPSMSFSTVLGAPEPSTCGLLAMTLLAAFGRRARCVRVAAAAVACGVAMDAGQVSAVTLFEDTFARADSRNIDGSLVGVTDNTGSSLVADGVYSQPFLDPANEPGPQDGDATNGGGAQILANELQLAVGAGTSNAFVNHNFVNSQILADGGFRVTMEVTSYGGASRGQGAAFAIGMSQADALTTGDANQLGPSMSGAFHPDAFIGNTYAAPLEVASDFWVAIRGNNSLVWAAGEGPIQGVPENALAAKTGVVSATFAPAGFSAGDSVAYEVFYDGVSQGFGAFAWSQDMSNYIGLDARDGAAVTFAGFAIETTDAAINPLRLQVNTDTGEVSIAGGDVANSLDYYEISSPSAGLLEGAFTGLSGAAGFPAGDGSGNGWELGGVQSAALLNEAYLQDASTVAAGASATSLGAIYDTSLGARDLVFWYDLPDGTSIPGYVEYLTGGSLLPDFNGNGVVDAADYTVWRDNLGTASGATLAQGDANGDGAVNAADYDLWVANFGAAATPVAGASAAPEPAGLVLSLAGLMLGSVRRARRR